MKNLVLGLIGGYDFPKLSPFLNSLQETGYQGDICFFYTDTDEETLQELKKRNIILIPFSMTRINIFVKKLHPYSALSKWMKSPFGRLLPINSIYETFVNFIAPRNEKDSLIRRNKLVAKILNIYSIRYPLYHSYLLENTHKYDYVMMTDVRDVIFQKDPFDFDIGDNLCCFLEDSRHTVKGNPNNRKLIEMGFGSKALEEVGNNRICCSGVTIGSADSVLYYLNEMVKGFLKLKSHPHGIDQGLHIYLLYKGVFKNAALFENRLGPVQTIAFTCDLPIRFDADGYLLNDDDSVPNVVHQYDRFFEYNGMTIIDNVNYVRLVYKNPLTPEFTVK